MKHRGFLDPSNVADDEVHEYTPQCGASQHLDPDHVNDFTGEAHAREDSRRVLDKNVDDSIAETIVTEAVAQNVELNEILAADHQHGSFKYDEAGIQPLQVYFEVGRCCLWQRDALFLGFFPFTP